MLRTIGAAAAALAVFGLSACSDSFDEPAGLAGNTTSPAATDTETPSESPLLTDEPPADEPETEPEQTPVNTFTQPYLPEERVVELRDTIPVEPPANASSEELEVLDVFEHVQAAWEQILWGVPFEESGFANYSTGVHLDTVRDYAQESIDRQRVSVGPPQEQHVLFVEADGSTAAVTVCVNTTGWGDVTPSGPEPENPLNHGTMTFEQVDGEWKSNRVSWSDDVTPCEGVFD